MHAAGDVYGAGDDNGDGSGVRFSRCACGDDDHDEPGDFAAVKDRTDVHRGAERGSDTGTDVRSAEPGIGDAELDGADIDAGRRQLAVGDASERDQ